MEMQDVSRSAAEVLRIEEDKEARNENREFRDENEEDSDGNEGERHGNEGARDRNEEDKKEEPENEKEVKVTLLKQISLDIHPEGDEHPTLPIKGLDVQDKHKEKPPMFLFPITRLKIAWTSSSNICEFCFKATFILFSTAGWMFCIGGVPFISLVLLIIGGVYVDDCTIQPNIPVYLIVAGVFGTLQHFIAVWTKYIPKDSQGRLKEYRSYCSCVDNIIHFFLAIWFVLGCIWVYGVYGKVDYQDTYKLEYCHKTLYLFAFWILNFSFIMLSILVVCGLCCILCVVTTLREPKDSSYA